MFRFISVNYSYINCVIVILESIYKLSIKKKFVEKFLVWIINVWFYRMSIW